MLTFTADIPKKELWATKIFILFVNVDVRFNVART